MQKRKNGRHIPAPYFYRNTAGVRYDTNDVFGDPPAGNVGHPSHGELVKESSHRLRVAPVRHEQLIRQGSEAFGNQAIVVAVDAKRDGERWEVYINAGTKPTGLDVLEWVAEVQDLGAGEILLTSIDSDGHKAGYDCELNAAVADAISIPVIASGGAGGPEDMLHVLTEGKADAALAASIFHYEKYSIADVKNYLRQNGVHVRI